MWVAHVTLRRYRSPRCFFFLPVSIGNVFPTLLFTISWIMPVAHLARKAWVNFLNLKVIWKQEHVPWMGKSRRRLISLKPLAFYYKTRRKVFHILSKFMFFLGFRLCYRNRSNVHIIREMFHSDMVNLSPFFGCSRQLKAPSNPHDRKHNRKPDSTWTLECKNVHHIRGLCFEAALVAERR